METDEASSQLSDEVRTSATGTASHSTVKSAGNASTNAGAVVSSTVMVCMAKLALPEQSTVSHVRVMVYS